MNIKTLVFAFCVIPLIASACNRSATQHPDTAEIVLAHPQSELCRVVVNYKNNRHLYVEFGKNGFKPIDAAGTLLKLHDDWRIISIAKFQFNGQRITSDELFIRSIGTTDDMLFQIRRPMKDKVDLYYDYKQWNFYCFSYAFHRLFDGLLYKQKYIGDLSKLVLSDKLELTNTTRLFNQALVNIQERKIELCEQKPFWMIYKNKPLLNYICEAIQLHRDLKVFESFGDFVTLDINTKATSCNGDYLEEYFSSIRIRSNLAQQRHFPINPFVKSFLPKELYENFHITHGTSAQLNLVLFTEGKKQRRSFGVALDWKDGKVTQIAELSKTPELLEDILRSIDKAPNGCGSFDWETAELVHKDGKRYSLGAFDSIAGIYWLSPDDELDWSAISSKAEPLVFNDYEYEPPQPMPNCEYFSEAYQAKLKYDEQARECGCFLSFQGSYNPSPKCHSEHYDYFYELYEDFVDEIEEAEGPNEDLDCGGGS